MKKFIYIFLLFTRVCLAQSYEFQTIDKRNIADGWEIRQISGTVDITDDIITISTDFNTQVLTIITQLKFIRHDDKIFTCINEEGAKINLRLYCNDALRKSFDLYYYGSDPNNKYFRFCLTKTE